MAPLPYDRDSVRIARRCRLPQPYADDLVARCHAAVDTAAPDTVVAYQTAARLHGLWLPDWADDEIHLATAEPDRAGRAMTRGRRPEFRAHRRQLAGIDRTVRHGIPVTSLARTWLDLAGRLLLPDLVAAGDSALRAGANPGELRDIVRRSCGQRGVCRAREALPRLDARSRSRPESHLRLAVVGQPGLPEFGVNEPVYRHDGGWLAEPDLSLAKARLALEYQGADHADPERMRQDITRAYDLRTEGWEVVFYGPAEVFGRPWLIGPDLVRTLRRRAPDVLIPPSGHFGGRVVGLKGLK